MLMLILNVVFVLVAVAMVALILMQRGSGAAAGSGFGAGASGTVFGARGASSFLSKSTKWLAVVFFSITLFMAWYATHSARPVVQQQDLGVMSQQAPAAERTTVPAPGELPAAPANGTVPNLPAAPATTVPPASSEVPAQPVPGEQVPVEPTPTEKP